MEQQFPPSGSTRPLSPWKALFRVLVAPRTTFAALGDSPPILPGYLAGMILSALLFVEVLKLLPGSLEERGMSDAPAYAVTFGAVFTLGLMLSAPWIAGAVNSAIAAVVGRMLGRDVKYSAYFGMIGYARLPVFLWGMLDSVFQLASVQIPQSPAFLVPKGSSIYLWAFADSLRPHDLWYFWLLAVGFATLQKSRVAKGALLPVTIYLLSLAFAFFKVATRGVPGW
ncbi:MAG TPA: YIP1 family protein [Symbiobacteriaceae bacterium]|nr:YIP1 family protein [Symbiobacteriaceae bacterium]